MSFVFSIILFFVLLFVRKAGLKLHFKGVSLSVTLLLFWTIILFFRGFLSYDLYDASFLVYLMVFGGCVSFVIGYSLSGVGHKNICNKDTVVINKFNILYYVALGFAIFVIVKQIMVLLPILLASGVSDARAEYSLDDLFLEGDWAILISYFARPFVKASLIIMVVSLFRQKIKVWDILLLLIILIVAFVSEGGRLLIMDVLFALLYMLLTNKESMSFKSKRSIYKVVLLIALFIVYSTIERGSSFIENMYTYYCGGLTYLDQALSSQEQLFEPSLYGLNCYQGLFKPLFGILHYFGIPKPDSLVLADKFILDAQDTYLPISKNGGMNYYMTAFGYAYRDGGLLFLCVDFIIYGAICCWFDKQETRKWGDVRWASMKVVLFYTMLYTMATFPFATYMPVMTLIYIYIITGRIFSKKIINNKTFIQ